MNSIDVILAQYDKSKEVQNNYSNNTNKMSDDERKKKYFSPSLENKNAPVGETGEVTIRILPTKDGSSPFVEVYFHEIKVGKSFLKLYDPGMNEGKDSPLNKTHADLMALGDKKSKDMARQYKAKKFYIVKIIDRANESDGAKFWRFKDAWKNDGPFDKIIPIFRKRGDITDPEKGRDLTLTFVKNKSNSGAVYFPIQSVLDEDPSPLHSDPAIAKEWLEDALTWENVYAKRSVDYLQGVAEGFEPVWSKTAKKWVWGADADDDQPSSSSATTAEQFLKTEEDDDDDLVDANDDFSDDDLPF